ncbi:MAG: hypothetical protein OEU92_25135, partial [Alphaproteobacteria bacterium]|nr:hypothetical protein [Alphaproteobacteria bacterium]
MAPIDGEKQSAISQSMTLKPTQANRHSFKAIRQVPSSDRRLCDLARHGSAMLEPRSDRRNNEGMTLLGR